MVEYSSDWKSWFQELSNQLTSALETVECKIEHVGSTSVEGLHAKPVIDIDVVLEDFGDFDQAKQKLCKAGYLYKGNLGLEGREMFQLSNPVYPHNLYVCDPRSLALKNHLVFRDYLRNNPEDARAYGVLKQNLAKQFPNDVDAYCEAKSDFIANILARCHFARDDVDSIRNANRVAD